MLGNLPVIPTIPTANIATAKAFYEDVLGFEVLDEYPDGVVYGTADGGFLLYQSEFAGTNKATAMTFEAADVDGFHEEVDALRAKGVTFDTFEVEDGVWENEVLMEDGMRGVWFTDPDGNILSLGCREGA